MFSTAEEILEITTIQINSTVIRPTKEAETTDTGEDVTMKGIISFTEGETTTTKISFYI